MKKVVLKLKLHDDQAKQKAMEAVSTVPGIDSITIDMKEQKLTMIGAADPVTVVNTLRKPWHAEILSVEPAKEPEKKKDEGEKKKVEGGEKKKDEGEKKKVEGGEKKDEGEKKKVEGGEEKKGPDDQIQEYINAYKMAVKLSYSDDRANQKVVQAVSIYQGIVSFAMDMKAKELTVIGTFDPVVFVYELRKYCHAAMISVQTAKEPETKKKVEGGEIRRGMEEGRHYKLYMTTHYYVQVPCFDLVFDVHVCFDE